MSVVKVELKKDGRRLKKTFTGQTRTFVHTLGNSVERWTEPVVEISGQIVFIVTATRPDELPLTLLSSPQLPQVGASYAEGGTVFARVYYVDGQPQFIGPRGKFWEYEVAYTLGGNYCASDNSETESNNDQSDETLLSFSVSVELEDWASAYDFDGLWNCNSIGDFFADPLMSKTGILTLQYQRRETFNPLPLAERFFQAVNNVDWHGFPEKTVKCSDISFSASQSSSGTTYDVTYKLQYRPRSWMVTKANSGFYYLFDGVKRRALNDDGSPSDQPILLAIDGSPLANGATVPIRSFRLNPVADLNELNLPNPYEI